VGYFLEYCVSTVVYLVQNNILKNEYIRTLTSVMSERDVFSYWLTHVSLLSFNINLGSRFISEI